MTRPCFGDVYCTVNRNYLRPSERDTFTAERELNKDDTLYDDGFAMRTRGGIYNKACDFFVNRERAAR